MESNKFSNSSIQRNEDQWIIKILRQDLDGLRREQKHLSSKAHERPLTAWESDRIRDLSREILDLLKRFLNMRPTASA